MASVGTTSTTLAMTQIDGLLIPNRLAGLTRRISPQRPAALSYRSQGLRVEKFRKNQEAEWRGAPRRPAPMSPWSSLSNYGVSLKFTVKLVSTSTGWPLSSVGS